MEVSAELIRNLERLSRIKLSPEEENRMEQELKGIFGFFEKLGELDLSGLPEMARPIETVNRLRPDQAQAVLSQQQALSVAIEQEEGFFKVPRVIE